MRSFQLGPGGRKAEVELAWKEGNGVNFLFWGLVYGSLPSLLPDWAHPEVASSSSETSLSPLTYQLRDRQPVCREMNSRMKRSWDR